MEFCTVNLRNEKQKNVPFTIQRKFIDWFQMLEWISVILQKQPSSSKKWFERWKKFYHENADIVLLLSCSSCSKQLFSLFGECKVYSTFILFDFYESNGILPESKYLLKNIQIKFLHLYNLACMNSQKLHPFDGKRSVTFKSYLWKVK